MSWLAPGVRFLRVDVLLYPRGCPSSLICNHCTHHFVRRPHDAFTRGVPPKQVTSRRVPRRPSSSRRTTRCARASAPAKWRGRAPWWCVGQAKPARQHAAAVRHRGAAREAHQSPLVNLRDQRPAAVALLSARCDGAPATLARRRRRRIPPRALGKSGRERGESALAAPRPGGRGHMPPLGRGVGRGVGRASGPAWASLHPGRATG